MKLRRLRLKLRTKLKNWRTEEREIDNGEGDDDVLDGIEDVEEAMKEDLAQVAEHVEPMRQVLYKLRKLAYSIKNSSTRILRARWKEIIKEVAPTSPEKLTVQMMPRDVRTRWNSTYDMLKFALAYRDAIDQVTSERPLKLRKYELSESEWLLVEDLQDCLKGFNYPCHGPVAH